MELSFVIVTLLFQLLSFLYQVVLKVADPGPT